MAESRVRDGDKGIDLLVSRVGQVLQANRFVVEFTRLPGELNGLGAENLSILCTNASLPGKEIETQSHIRHRMMPTGQVGYGDSIDFTFLCDQLFMDRIIIEEWQRMIHNASVETRTVLEGDRDTQIFRFYNDFIGECKIHVLRKDGTAAVTYTIYECYPVSLAPIELSMEEADTPLKFTYTMNYKHWTADYSAAMGDIEMNQPMEGNFELSGLNKGRRIFDAILQGLKVAGRFNKKAGELGRKLGSFDTAITRGSNIARDLGVGAKYITNERRGTSGGGS